MRFYASALLVAVLALTVSGCATIGTSPKGLELPIEKAAITLNADVVDGIYKLVSTDNLKRFIDEGKRMTVISTLPAEDDIRFGMIPGALSASMPRSDKELATADMMNLFKVAGEDKTRTIVVYCGNVACRRSHHAAKMLVANGYKSVYRYPGGIISWREAGFPLVTLPARK